MAEMPAPISSSSAQAGYQARDVGSENATRRAEQVRAAEQQNRTTADAGEIVDTSDADNRVFADAEGSGGQGRAHQEPVPAEEGHEGSDEGLKKGPDGRMHLDLKA